MASKPSRFWAVPLMLAAGSASPAFGQQVTATLTGIVTDATEAARNDAAVVALNQKTLVEYSAKSNDAGVYTISGLPVGSYLVRASARGFKTLTTNVFTLETGQVARVNVKLEVGDLRENVLVEGVSALLQTQDAHVGEVISGTTVQQMPLNGRNFSQLTLLVPGVQTHAPDTFTNPKQGIDSGRPYVNGQREQANNYMIDGIDMNEAVENTVAYYPSPDAIAEMKVETNNYSAEFGNVAGGIISVVIKSGSNELHGNAFEFARNDAFDANGWANNQLRTASGGPSKDKLKQNIFGATLGGPLVKNKVFFFADYQGQITDRPGDGMALVAPASWRNGDFSDLGIPIIDPLTGQPFPGNVIPADRISPIAKGLFANTTNYPLPTGPGTNFNYSHHQENSTHNHQGDLRIDAHLGPRDNVSVRGSVGHYATATSVPVVPLFFGNDWVSNTQNLSANWTRVFGPTSVNELRVGFNHNTSDGSPGDPGHVGNYNAVIGIPGGQAIPGLAYLGFDGGGTWGVGTPGGGGYASNKVYQAADKLSFSRGRHSVSVGGAFLHYEMNQFYFTGSGVLGSYFYDGAVTGLPFADFLLDRVSFKGVGAQPDGSPIVPWTQLQNRFGLFVQDDYKPSSSLTLNLGLRWEYTSPLTETNNRQENFDLGPDNTGSGAELIAGQNSSAAAGLQPFYGGFSPRVGFAWTANPKTVFRGAFGMVRYSEGTGANCRLTLNPAFGVDRGAAFPGYSSAAVGFADLGEASFQRRAWQLDIQPQLTKQWNFFAERALTGTASLSVGYVGSRATHVVAFDQANVGRNPGDPVPFPQFGFVRYTSDAAVINYDALQASIRWRKSHGLEFLGSYTFSKTLTDNQGFYGPGWGDRAANQLTAGMLGDGNYNFYDKRLDYGRPWFSAKHTGSLSVTYDLPIGNGRAIGGGWSGVTQALLGGWNLSGILTVRSGLPITVVNFVFAPSVPFGADRPNIVGDPHASNPGWDHWLNSDAFQAPAPNSYGNSGVGILDGPGFYNVDLGLDKRFGLGHSRALTLRVEAFNALNHPNKGLPNRVWSDPLSFGKITEVANAQRILELAVKFTF